MKAQAGRAVVVVGVERVIRQVARDKSDRQLSQALEELQREREDSGLLRAVAVGEA